MLAPSFAFAFGDADFSEHCPSDDGLVRALIYQAGAASSEASVHSLNHRHTSNHVGAAHHHHGSMGMADQSAPAAPRGGHHATSHQQCCVLCIPAMPAAMTEVATPSAPQAFFVPEAGLHLIGYLPTQLYRPPIS
jgi:hypothetical protein